MTSPFGAMNTKRSLVGPWPSSGKQPKLGRSTARSPAPLPDQPEYLDPVATALATRYRIERELGRGGMATVYLAHDLTNDRPVAIKVLRPEIAHALGPERFLREIKLTANLDHPHILALYESGEAGGVLYYVMPYVEGETLRDRLHREKQLPIDDALRITREVADALDFAHQRGIVHRDIKPENILLAAGHARVADFGIARAIHAAGGDRLTATGITVGTVEYMSPEQAAGDRELDGRSDVYALGCVLYEMLAGTPPFSGPTVEGVIRQQLSTEPTNITTLRPAVSGTLAGAVARALAKTPADRFATAAQFANALTPAPVTTQPDAAPKRLRVVLLRAAIAIGLLAVLGGLGAWLSGRLGSQPGATGARPMLVVLPFANLGPPDDAYFADGITDAITARLAAVASLGVISRTSAVQYAQGDKTPAQIGEELGVGYILEGTVQRERPGDPTSRVRIIPQLIRIADNTHLWADIYDESMAEVFRIQSTIAERVARALEVTLVPAEREALVDRPTDNPAAYELYLEAKRYGRVRPDGARAAVALLERAIALDSAFALAYVEISRYQLGPFFQGTDRSDERLRLAKQAADRALALRPNLALAHRALGYYYYEGLRDYDRALGEFAIAARGLPNDETLLVDVAYIWRRQGRVVESIENLKKAYALNPRSWFLPQQIAAGLVIARRYADAIPYFEQAIGVSPGNIEAHLQYAWAYVTGSADTAAARRVLERIPEGRDTRGIDLLIWMDIYRLERNPTAAIARLRVSHTDVIEFQPAWIPRVLLIGEAYLQAADTLRARTAFDSARIRLEDQVARNPDDARLYSALGRAYAGLGQAGEAVAFARRGVQLDPPSKDILLAASRVDDLVTVLLQVGDREAALDELERLFTFASGHVTSPALLRADPRFDPLRGNPRFERLVNAGGPDSVRAPTSP